MVGNDANRKVGSMKTEKFDGKVEAYQGKALDKPIEFAGEVQVYENVTEAKAGEDWLSENEILKTINKNLVTAAKAKAYQEATKDLKKAYEESADYKRDQLIKAAVAAGFSKPEAEALAASKLS